MRDLDQAIRDAGRRYEPPGDWYERVQARARRKRRNQRILAATVGVALPLAVIVPLVWNFATSDPTPRDGRGAAGGPAPCGISIPVTGWWRFDGSGADTVAGLDADLRGDATFAPGLVGDALTLDGDGDFAEVPDDPALDIGRRDFTVLLWVRFDDIAGEPQVLVEQWVQRSPRGSFGWTLQKLGNTSIGFYTQGGAGVGGAQSDRLDIQANTWIHVAARRSGDTFQIFIDGEIVASGPGLAADLDSASTLKFGHRGGSDDTPGATLRQEFFLSGQLDEVALVVGRALSKAEIRSIYEKQAACAA